jgi:GNAT superfamily N-acetyltransferase
MDYAEVCEFVEAAHLREQLRALGPEAQARALEVAGGVAALTVPEFGRKLNHVTGAGVNEPLAAEQLEAVEVTYAARGMPVEVDLCPHAQPPALELLGARGYRVNAFTNVYWSELTAPLQAATGLHLRRAGVEEHEHLIGLSVRGFAAHSKPRSAALLQALARAATARADTRLYVAESADGVVGSAAFALVPTALGPVAYLYLASTLPEFRRRGVQAALLALRAREARNEGAVLATLTARPGTSHVHVEITSGVRTESAGHPA